MFRNNKSSGYSATSNFKKSNPKHGDVWNKSYNKRGKSRIHRNKYDSSKGIASLFQRDKYKNRKRTNLNYGTKSMNSFSKRSMIDPNPNRSWNVGLSVGPTNSLTDVGGNSGSGTFLSDMQWSQTRLSYGVFARYKQNSMLAYSAWFHMADFAASDSYSNDEARKLRGFSYTNRIFELSVRPEFHFPYIIISRNRGGINTSFDYFVFAGLAAFRNSPTFVSKQYIPTEYTTGYKRIQLAMPLGIGGYFSFPNRTKIGLDLGLRKTFTDHFDGVTREFSHAKDYYLMGSVNVAFLLHADKRRFNSNKDFYKPKLKRKKPKKVERQKSMFFR